MKRRDFLTGSLFLAGAACCPNAFSASPAYLAKAIPSSGEHIHPVGMGTWITFNVGDDKYLRNQRTAVLNTFFEYDGTIVDSSPMYGSAEKVMGYALNKLHRHQQIHAATKTWTSSSREAKAQFSDSREFWGLKQFWLLQIHNLIGWRTHLPFLRELKQDNKIRYIGVTTSHGRRHQELAKILQTQAIDFVQLTYNIADTEAHNRLIPLAADNGVAVMVNRPFRGGELFQYVRGKPLPAWASDMNMQHWSQFFLRYILAHPDVTSVIPATTQVTHMHENMQAAEISHWPGDTQRRRMLTYFNAL